MQSKESREMLVHPTSEIIDKTKEALWKLRQTYERLSCTKIWSHGSVFDITILKEAFKSFDINIPWSSQDVRDTRTLFDLANFDYQHTGNNNDMIHHAVVDAIRQANQVISAKKKLLNQPTASETSSA